MMFRFTLAMMFSPLLESVLMIPSRRGKGIQTYPPRVGGYTILHIISIEISLFQITHDYTEIASL